MLPTILLAALLSLLLLTTILASPTPEPEPADELWQTAGSTMAIPEINVNGTLGASLNCFPQKPGRTYVAPPTFQKCAVALRYFPADDRFANFHSGGAWDNWRLPQEKTYGSCVIKVEAVKEDSFATWTMVGLAATQLVLGCAAIGETGSGAGGMTYSGSTNGIKISVLPKIGVGSTTSWQA